MGVPTTTTFRVVMEDANGHIPGDPAYVPLGGNPNTSGGTPRISQGNYQSLPTPTANGAELPNRPAYTDGVLLSMPAGSTLTGFKAPAGSAPTGPANGNQKQYKAANDLEEPIYLGAGENFFVTDATNGTGAGAAAIQFEWVQR